MVTRKRVIWGKWDCSDCQTKGISGEHKQCPHCGAARDQKELDGAYLGKEKDSRTGRVLGVEENDLVDKKDQGHGPDWSCEFCGSNNRGTNPKCHNCGADGPRREGDIIAAVLTDDWAVDGGDAGDETKPGGEVRIKAGRTNAMSEGFKQIYGTKDFDPEANWKAAVERQQALKKRKMGLIAIGVTLGVVALSLFLWWAFSTKDVPGVVTHMQWQHKTHQERWTEVTKEGWEDDLHQRPVVMPSKGAGERAGIDILQTSCQEKHHHDERYVCGSHTECHDERYKSGESCHESCSSSSNGDGSFTETCRDICTDVYDTRQVCEDVDDYCERPIYETWCKYKTWEWQHVDTKTASGGGKVPEPWWEEYSWAEELEQYDRSRRQAEYRVDIEYERKKEVKEHTENPRSQPAYISWDVGEEVVLRVRNIGTVAEVVRGDAAGR